MIVTTVLIIAIILLTVGSIAFLVFKPSVTAERSGKILAFVSMFILPTLALYTGGSLHLERSKQTKFCLSCHVMSDYGKSLLVDDEEFLAANHFQNRRIPRENACYTCHTDYTMFGDVSGKLRGLKHVYVHYLGTVPDTVKLYSPYNNRECLHCHEGARSFEENPVHTEEISMLASMKSNELSCLTSGCHDVVHNVRDLDDVDLWRPSYR